MAMDFGDESSIRSSQFLGQVEEEDGVLSLTLRKVYCDIDETNDNRLLWTSHLEKVIKSGTLTRLVRQLAPHGEDLDHSYRTAFLAVYRTFATPTELLKELTEWYKKVADKDEYGLKELEEKTSTLRSILTFIRLWLDKYLCDFNHPPTYNLLAILEEFLVEQTKSPSPASPEASELLRHVLELRQKLISQASLSADSREGSVEERAIDDLYDWLNMSPVQVARDLTALDADMFGSLVPHECLHYVRHQTDQSQTIYKSIQHFNKVICLVITTVLQYSVNGSSVYHNSGSPNDSLDDSDSNDRDYGTNTRPGSHTPPNSCSSPVSGFSSHSMRGRYISHWIDIAQQCRLLKNFSSLKAIVFGLQSSAINRLYLSWATVSNERQSIFKELLDLFSSDSNFQMFREVVNKAKWCLLVVENMTVFFSGNKHTEEATGKRADMSPHRGKKADMSPHKKTRPHKSTGTPKDLQNVVIGVIPYLGTFLSDLTMLHNALPDTNKEGHINFEKRRQEFEILAKISLFQTASGKYNLTKNPSLHHWIYHTHLLSENESFLLSIDLEPPLPSPVSKPSSSPLCQTLIRRSLRLLHSTTTSKRSTLSVPADPRARQSFDGVIDGGKKDEEEEGSLIRSSSCFELNEHLVVRVTVKGMEEMCNYKSIYISKSDHTSKVIEKALEKHDIPTSEKHKFQMSQELSGKGEQKHLSLIPDGACVYYALDTRTQPKLFIHVKEGDR